MRNLLPVDGEVFLCPGFLGEEEAIQLQSLLECEVPWSQEPIRMFGKMVMQPRLTAWYGEADHPYGYSGVQLTPAPWPSFLMALKEKVETAGATTFTGVLLNRYRDGQDSMGWHRDNEAELGPNPVVASLSLGQERRFLLRHMERQAPDVELRLRHGDLLVMRGATQHHWQHSVPKSAAPMGQRINLTFRAIRKIPARP